MPYSLSLEQVSGPLDSREHCVLGDDGARAGGTLLSELKPLPHRKG